MSYSARVHGGGPEYSVSGSGTDEAGRRCALHFNPGSHEPTEKIKLFCAAAMKAIIDEGTRIHNDFQARIAEIKEKGLILPDAEQEAYGDAMRCFATALTHLEAGQMFAVKGLHTRANAGITE